MNKKLKLFIQKGPKGYLKLVGAAGKSHNDGMLCLCHGRLWFKEKGKSPRYLISEIKEAGYDVTGDNSFANLSKGKSPCVGGTGYLGSLSFPEAESLQNNSDEIIAPAKKFLNKFYRLSEV
jgi:hypothetical protein